MTHISIETCLNGPEAEFCVVPFVLILWISCALEMESSGGKFGDLEKILSYHKECKNLSFAICLLELV